MLSSGCAVGGAGNSRDAQRRVNSWVAVGRLLGDEGLLHGALGAGRRARGPLRVPGNLFSDLILPGLL